MRLITLYLPEGYLALIDSLVKQKFYPNRSEAIRFFIRDGLLSHGPLLPNFDYLLKTPVSERLLVEIEPKDEAKNV